MDFFAFDDDYVRRLREGDRWTEKHYEKYFKPLLTAKLRRRGVPTSDIEDIIQDVHYRVLSELRKGNGVRDGHKFGAYVSSVCNHVLQEYWRRNRPTDVLQDIFPAPDDPLRDLIVEEIRERVRLTLLWLADDDRRDAVILNDLYFRELDKDAICRKHGVERSYLRVLIHRALKKFRGKYDDPDDS